MNSKRTFIIGLVVIAALVGVKFYLLPPDVFFEPVRFIHGALSDVGGWFQTVHVGHNAWMPWRVDPFLGKLAVLFPNPARALFGLLLAFHALGVTALSFFVTPALGLRAAGLLGVLVSAILLHLFSLDFVLFGALVWWPWLTVAFIQAVRMPLGRALPFFIIVLFFALRLAKGGNTAAPFVVGAAVAAAAALLTPEERSRRGSVWAAALLCVLPLFFVGRGHELGAFPDYPLGARLVPDDGVPGFTRALVGPDRPLPIIDRFFLDRAYSKLTLALVVVSAWSWLVTRRNRRELGVIGGSLGVAAACAIGAAWDALTPAIGEISPLRTLERIVPSLGVTPLLPIAAALAVSLLALGAAFSRRLTPLGLIALLTLTASFEEGRFSWSLTALPGSIQRGNLSHVREAQERIDAAPQSPAASALLSPSAGLIAREGMWTVTNWDLEGRIRWLPLADAIGEITVSGNDAAKMLVVDGDLKTRWSAGTGVQSGGEFIRFTFKTPTRLGGIELHPGAFATDFPSGLEVVTRDECEASAAVPVVSMPKWLGSIRRTESGLPYYGAETTVRVRFPGFITTRCLEVRQTGSGRAVDWSIAEVNGLRPLDKPARTTESSAPEDGDIG